MEEREIDGAVLKGSDFTVAIKNLPQNDDPRVFKAELWRHIERILEENAGTFIKVKNDPNACKIADIYLGMSDYGVMHFYLKRTELAKQETMINIKISILEDTDMDESEKDKKLKKYKKRLTKVQKKKEKNEQAYEKFKAKNQQKIVKAYVTMKSMEGKLRLMELYEKENIFAKCCRSKERKKRMFKGKMLDVRHPAPPSLILWENLGVSRKERCFRISIVALISILLMILTFIIIVFARDFQSSLSQEYKTSSCPSDPVSQYDALADQLKDKSERTGLMHCYCLDQYKEHNFDVKDIVFSNGKKYCSDWLYSYSVNNTLIWCMVLVMSMINVMLKVALRILSEYERRHDKTDLVISNTFKMFFVQFCNTALIILIVNAKLDFMPSWSPIFNGDYDDFTTEWYRQIGVSIILTMLIGVVSPHLANSMFWAKGALKRL